MTLPRPCVILGNPENRRVAFFQQALAQANLPPALVLPYAKLLDSTSFIETIPPNAIVRIESPGENFEVEKKLLTLGADQAEHEGYDFLPSRLVNDLAFDVGRIWPNRQWYLGFQQLLQSCRQYFVSRPDLFLCQSPTDILTFFDKIACHQRLAHANLPVAPALPWCSNTEQLFEHMESNKINRVFLKLAHSSSASGVVALRKVGPRHQALTTMEIDRQLSTTRFYNSRKLRTYVEPNDLHDVLQFLFQNRVHIEHWLPKAKIAGTNFDLRILVIAGRPQHVVVRCSDSPITNLHLGNRRGDLDAVRSALGPNRWNQLLHTSEQAAKLFPASHTLAIDMLVAPDLTQHVILEINAFGDLLPNIVYQNKSTYQAQVSALPFFSN